MKAHCSLPWLGILLAASCADGGAAPGADAGPAPDELLRVTEDPPDLPLRGLTPEEEAAFLEGDARFEQLFRANQGLGPLYIRASCASCHQDDAKGPGFVEKFVVDGAPPTQGTVRPYTTTPDASPVLAPDGARVSRRVGPAVFGRGYLEAIDEDAIVAGMMAQAAAPGPVKGIVARVTFRSAANADPRFHAHTSGDSGLVGRFGVKARVASVDDFVADAFQGDMGLTSPYRPLELENPDGVTDDAVAGVDLELETIQSVAMYVRTLDIPRRDGVTDAGLALLDEVGCTACHTASLPTRVDYPIAALAGIEAPVFTDLLLHDMGEGLADGVVDEGASGRHWRTAPLMGLRFFVGYLHDGRALTLDDAIRAHDSEGSEASEAVAAYAALDDDDRALLLDTLSRL